MGLDRSELRTGCGWKIGLEAVLDHGGMGRGYKVELRGLTGWHEGFASFKAKRQPTMPGLRHSAGKPEPGIYRPMTITVKLPRTIAGRGRGFSVVGSGRGPNSAVTV
jgi:hypothetical protein